MVHGGVRRGEKVRCDSSPLLPRSKFINLPVKGCFIEPTILLNVPVSSDAYQEEIFGPVVIVNTFKDEAEALTEANNTEFGLFCELSLFFPRDLISRANHSQPPFTRMISNALSGLRRSLKQVQLALTAPCQYAHSTCRSVDGSSQAWAESSPCTVWSFTPS